MIETRDRIAQRCRTINIRKIFYTFSSLSVVIEFARETFFALVTVERLAISYSHWTLLGQVVDQEVHGDVFAVDVQPNVGTDLFGHDVRVEVQVPTMKKGSTS